MRLPNATEEPPLFSKRRGCTGHENWGKIHLKRTWIQLCGVDRRHRVSSSSTHSTRFGSARVGLGIQIHQAAGNAATRHQRQWIRETRNRGWNCCGRTATSTHTSTADDRPKCRQRRGSRRCAERAGGESWGPSGRCATRPGDGCRWAGCQGSGTRGVGGSGVGDGIWAGRFHGEDQVLALTARGEEETEAVRFAGKWGRPFKLSTLCCCCPEVLGLQEWAGRTLYRLRDRWGGTMNLVAQWGFMVRNPNSF